MSNHEFNKNLYASTTAYREILACPVHVRDFFSHILFVSMKKGHQHYEASELNISMFLRKKMLGKSTRFKETMIDYLPYIVAFHHENIVYNMIFLAFRKNILVTDCTAHGIYKLHNKHDLFENNISSEDMLQIKDPFEFFKASENAKGKSKLSIEILKLFIFLHNECSEKIVHETVAEIMSITVEEFTDMISGKTTDYEIEEILRCYNFLGTRVSMK